MSGKRYFIYVIAALGWLLLFFAFFSLMQIEPIYKNSMGLISKNYVWQDDVMTSQKIPYLKITTERLLHWDAEHYNTLRESGYNTANSEVIFLYAFFPLFPLLWRFLSVSPLGIGIVNYILFALSVFLLQELFKDKFTSRREIIHRYLIALSSPLLVVFLIPYTEALFMFCLSIGIHGLVKKKYWLYFAGFMFAAMTRSAVTILLISFVVTTIFMSLKYFRLKQNLVHLLYLILPTLVGTLLVAIFQYSTGSGKLLIYIDAIKTWDTTLQVPHNIRDWSLESFSIVIGIICIVIPALAMYLMQIFFKNARKISEVKDVSLFDTEKYRKEYMFIFSLFYTLGMFLTILLFKGGSLNGVARYLVCSPFFYFSLYSLPEKIEKINTDYKIMFLGSLVLLSIFFLGMIPFSTHWDFADFGLWVFILLIMLWVFYHDLSGRVRWVLIAVLLFSALIWNTFLYNVFLSNGWLFT